MDPTSPQGLEPRVALYPGCTLESSAISYEVSLGKVLSALGIPCDALDEWCCCGASSAHSLSHGLHLSLSLRNLVLAEKQGYKEILAPCAACYHRLASANLEFANAPQLLKRMNIETGMDYQGTVRVRNILDFFCNVVGVERIASAVRNPLSGLRVACYYGCLNTRVPRLEKFDDVEYPMSMDRIARALGAETVDWSYKTDCCGGSLFITAESVSARLVSAILKDAVAQGADCIAVSCPMCQSNLDVKQSEIRSEFSILKSLPVVFITQLLALAFGFSKGDAKFDDNFVPFTCLEQDRA